MGIIDVQAEDRIRPVVCEREEEAEGAVKDGREYPCIRVRDLGNGTTTYHNLLPVYNDLLTNAASRVRKRFLSCTFGLLFLFT